MVKDTTGSKAAAVNQLSSHNPFSVLSLKKVSKQVHQGDKPKEKRTLKSKEPEEESKKTVEETATSSQPKQLNKKEAKILSITSEPPKPQDELKTDKDLKKEDKVQERTEKVLRDQSDRRDRSGKGFRVRKEGKGTGGWEETEPAPEFPVEGAEAEHTAAPSGVEEGEPSPKKEDTRTPEQIEQEKKEEEARELEERQMTYEEYLKKKSTERVEPQREIRKVDTTSFANMKAVHHAKTGDAVELKISLKESSNAKKTNEAEKKVEKKPEKREVKKLKLEDTGFRMDNPARGERRGGRGMRDGGGRGRGRGRGGYSGREPRGAAAYNSSIQLDNEELFPALPTTVASSVAVKSDNDESPSHSR